MLLVVQLKVLVLPLIDIMRLSMDPMRVELETSEKFTNLL